MSMPQISFLPSNGAENGDWGRSIASRDKIMDFQQIMNANLKYLINVLPDSNASLELGGIRLDADAKTGPAGVFLIESWMSDQQFVFSQLLESYKFEQSLQKQMDNLFAS